ncbi:DUF5412 family protein [Paenibacillus pinistramenti]|uniref:DUF5412 family protein n=1 Tax=Paenibacillus pinistramenti TaxID=1768003 RepID=UPI001107C524|nr:hypothetical protein [Paenibacillus pinistramenti]
MTPDEEELNLKRDTRKITRRSLLAAFLFGTAFIGIAVYWTLHNVNEAMNRYLCENKVLSTLEQPNGRHDLVYFERNCGATTGFSYQISLIRHGARLNSQSGNLYISDKPFTAYWTDGDVLVVLEPGSRAYRRKTSYQGVAVQYKDLCSKQGGCDND